MPPIDLTRRTALYRFFDAEGRLLYVGVAYNPEERWKGHAYEKAWWEEVAEKRVVWHETRIDALAAELAAIRDELPKYNIREGRVPLPGGTQTRKAAKPARVFRVDDATWADYRALCAAKGVEVANDLRMYMLREIKAHEARQRKIAAEERAASA
jgi:hypothetical protein